MGPGHQPTLPGQESDAHNRDTAREIIRNLFSLWDLLAERNAPPDELYVAKIDPGDGAIHYGRRLYSVPERLENAKLARCRNQIGRSHLNAPMPALHRVPEGSRL